MLPLHGLSSCWLILEPKHVHEVLVWGRLAVAILTHIPVMKMLLQVEQIDVQIALGMDVIQ